MLSLGEEKLVVFYKMDKKFVSQPSIHSQHSWNILQYVA